MPSRNIVRQDMEEAFYHVYSRGVNKGDIFACSEDKDYFLYLLSRHLSRTPVHTRLGYCYPHYRGEVELMSYCLMDNHFHLLFFQVKQGSLSQLMKSVLTAYTVYFNRKYKRSGHLFESCYKSALVDNDEYLLHVSRYVHLNPRSWRHYPHSSLGFIVSGNEPEWLQTGRLLALHESRSAYLNFVADYEENKKILSEIKHQLANL